MLSNSPVYYLQKILNALTTNQTFTPAYGTMAITQRDTNDASPNVITVAAHPSGTSTLNPPASVASGATVASGYYKVTGWVLDGENESMTLSDNALVSTDGGVFLTTAAWGSFRHSQNNATVAFVFGIDNGTTITFSQRPTADKQANIGDVSNAAGGGKARIPAGGKVSVWIASDIAGDITLGNANVTALKVAD